MDLTPGQTIGQYRIVKKMGEGGMGAVYKADQPSIPRAVVIKVLGSAFAGAPDARDRFRREVDMITRLEHPHSLRLWDQVALALDSAHARGIFPRDLKPANILVDDADNAYLADFGLAKSISGTQDLTATGSTLGSPAYMSPEQARGEKLTRRSDIYAFSVLVYRMLAGRLPLEADTAWGFITAHLSEEPVPIRRYAPDLPPAVEAVLADGLAKDPLARPERATDLMTSLRAGLTAGADVPASPSARAPTRATATASTPGGRLISPVAASGAQGSAVSRRAAPAWRLPALAAAGAAALLLLGGIAAAALYIGGTSLAGDRPTSYPVGDEPRALLFDGSSLWVAPLFPHPPPETGVVP